jgi:uncharacterized membrane protein
MIAEIDPTDMLVWMIKFIHVATIAVWASGLVSTPFLLAQRRRYDDGTVHRLHRLVRTLHVQIVSPAAFAAVASGIALIFLRDIYFVWFTTKLYFVALLVSCHVGVGLLIASTFEPGRPPRPDLRDRPQHAHRGRGARHPLLRPRQADHQPRRHSRRDGPARLARGLRRRANGRGAHFLDEVNLESIITPMPWS